jgi:hypothetical protein
MGRLEHARGWPVRGILVAALLCVLAHRTWPAFPERLVVREKTFGMCERCGMYVGTTTWWVMGVRVWHSEEVEATEMSGVLARYRPVGVHGHAVRNYSEHELTFYGEGYGCGHGPDALFDPLLPHLVENLYAHVGGATGDLWRDRVMGQATERAAENALQAMYTKWPRVEDLLLGTETDPRRPNFVQWWRQHGAEMEATFLAGR